MTVNYILASIIIGLIPASLSLIISGIQSIFVGNINHLNNIIFFHRFKYYISIDKSSKSHFWHTIILMTIVYGFILLMGYCTWMVKDFTSHKLYLRRLYTFTGIKMLLYTVSLILLMFIYAGILCYFFRQIGKCKISNINTRVRNPIINSKYYIITTLKNGCYLAQKLNQINVLSNVYEIISPDNNILTFYYSPNILLSKSKSKKILLYQYVVLVNILLLLIYVNIVISITIFSSLYI